MKLHSVEQLLTLVQQQLTAIDLRIVEEPADALEQQSQLPADPCNLPDLIRSRAHGDVLYRLTLRQGQVMGAHEVVRSSV
jgi:hypothetical protein